MPWIISFPLNSIGNVYSDGRSSVYEERDPPEIPLNSIGNRGVPKSLFIRNRQTHLAPRHGAGRGVLRPIIFDSPNPLF